MFIFIFLFLLIIFLYLICSSSQPYDLVMVFGKKGAGKSTFLTSQAIKYHLKGWKIYSTVDVPFANPITPQMLKSFGQFKFPEKSLLLIDEVGMIWDNRDFKNFNSYTRDYFKLQRHYKNKIILFSQAFDIDKKLRDLTDKMYLIKRIGKISILKPIIKKVDVTTDMNGQGSLTEVYKFGLFIFNKFLFLPRYYNAFDSHEIPSKAEYSYDEVNDYDLFATTKYSSTFKREFKRIYQKFIQISKKFIKISKK